MKASAAGPAAGAPSAACTGSSSRDRLLGDVLGKVGVATCVIRTSCVLTTEMPIDPPILRDRLSSAAAVSASAAAASRSQALQRHEDQAEAEPWTTPLMITGRDGWSIAKPVIM